MNNRFAKIILFFFIVAALVLALPSPVFAQGPSENDSPVIFGSNYVLSPNQVIKDLVVFGGNATLEAGSTVTGDVVILGGNLIASGEIRGDVTAFGGDTIVSDSAVIGGDLNTIGGSSQVSPRATIRGKRLTGIGTLPFRIPTRIYTPSFWIDFGPGAGILSAIFGSLILALLAVLISLFLPAPTNRVGLTISSQPVISGAMGLLTLVVTPALFLVLAITIILIPLGLVGLLVFGIAILFGWSAMGLELGKRVASLFNVRWAIPVSAGVGTLLISLVTNFALVLTSEWFWTLCCIGIPLVGLVMMVGLGGVVASKFGATVYNPARPVTSLPPAYPQGPVPPAGGPSQPPAPGTGGPEEQVVQAPQPAAPQPPVQETPPPVAPEPSTPPEPSEPPLPPPAGDQGTNI